LKFSRSQAIPCDDPSFLGFTSRLFLATILLSELEINSGGDRTFCTYANLGRQGWGFLFQALLTPTFCFSSAFLVLFRKAEMSARQPFFPAASSRPESRATFAPDQGNPLHQNSGPIDTAAHADLKQQSFARKLVNMGQNETNMDNANSGKPHRTAGLAGLMKKKNQVAGAAGPVGPVGGSTRTLADNTVRPGTADPHSLMHRASTSEAKFPIVAPTPQKFSSLVSSPLLSRSRSGASSVSFSASPRAFKVPYLEFNNVSADTSGKKAHTLTLEGSSSLDKTSDHREGAFSGNGSDEHHQGDELRNGTRSGSIMDQGNPNGPRRVVIQPESHQYNGGMEECSTNFSGIQGHELTEEGRIKVANSRKRMREEYEQDDDSFRFQNPAKRYRGQHNDFDNIRESVGLLQLVMTFHLS